MLRVNMPFCDTEVFVDYEVVGKDTVKYSGVYLISDGMACGDEFPAEKLFLANGIHLSDYFNMKLQEKASQILAGE